MKEMKPRHRYWQEKVVHSRCQVAGRQSTIKGTTVEEKTNEFATDFLAQNPRYVSPQRLCDREVAMNGQTDRIGRSVSVFWSLAVLLLISCASAPGKAVRNP